MVGGIMIGKFYWDTYAIVELIKGNSKFMKYFSKDTITSELNLMELYYHMLRLFDQDQANKQLNEWAYFAENIPQHVMKLAMQYRFRNKVQRLSYIDCMGYMFAVSNGMKFLTGDKQFEGLPHVEFVH